MVSELRSLKVNLEETLEELRRQFFGTKSEKSSSRKKSEEPEATRSVPVKSHTRKVKPKATRDELYADLPIQVITCPVPEEERFCNWCNEEMVPLKPKYVREEIRITPAKVERIHYYQEVLICPACHRDRSGILQ